MKNRIPARDKRIVMDRLCKIELSVVEQMIHNSITFPRRSPRQKPDSDHRFLLSMNDIPHDPWVSQWNKRKVDYVYSWISRVKPVVLCVDETLWYIDCFFLMFFCLFPICSMYGMFTNICHKNHPTVGKYTGTMEHMGLVCLVHFMRPARNSACWGLLARAPAKVGISPSITFSLSQSLCPVCLSPGPESVETKMHDD